MRTVDINKIWRNGTIPVVYRPGNNDIKIKLPYAEGNRKFLKGGTRKREPVWDKKKKFWKLPKSRFNNIVDDILNRYKRVYIIQPYTETEQCAPACMNAQGYECQCSCLGANHGAGNDGRWFEISESLALKYGEDILGCRLLKVEA